MESEGEEALQEGRLDLTGLQGSLAQAWLGLCPLVISFTLAPSPALRSWR